MSDRIIPIPKRWRQLLRPLDHGRLCVVYKRGPFVLMRDVYASYKAEARCPLDEYWLLQDSTDCTVTIYRTANVMRARQEAERSLDISPGTFVWDSKICKLVERHHADKTLLELGRLPTAVCEPGAMVAA